MARIRLEAWEPGQAEAWLEEGGAAVPALPAEEGPWEPRREAARPPGPWVFVDGVERVEALVWTEEGAPGLLFSYAVGAVVRDEGGIRLAGPVEVRRVFASPRPFALELAPGLSFSPLKVEALAPEDLLAAAREVRRRAEWELGKRVLKDLPGALLFHDGPLFFGEGGEKRLGFVKSFHRRYLAEEHAGLLRRLAPGERTPVFRVPAEARRTPRDFFSWYLRLPLAPASPFSPSAGLIRVETGALDVEEAKKLAAYSLYVLPRLASSPYRDPRAPANLLPVGGLERELKRRLGSRELIRRQLVRHLAG